MGLKTQESMGLLLDHAVVNYARSSTCEEGLGVVGGLSRLPLQRMSKLHSKNDTNLLVHGNHFSSITLAPGLVSDSVIRLKRARSFQVPRIRTQIICSIAKSIASQMCHRLERCVRGFVLKPNQGGRKNM